MMNEQENLLELYDYITDRVNTKYPDISDLDRDDIIQDIYLKTYTTYLAKHQNTPKYKRNAYVINYVKRYVSYSLIMLFSLSKIIPVPTMSSLSFTQS